MSQMSLSADETGSAVVCCGCAGACRRATRLSLYSGYAGGWRCHWCEVLSARFIGIGCQLRVSNFQKRGDRFARFAAIAIAAK